VDEVLAVGDAEFQKKAIGKMQNISHGDGRTVLFVSHNMTAIKNLCKKGILLQNGIIKKQDEIETLVDSYLSDETIKGIVNKEWEQHSAPGTSMIRVKRAYVSYEGTYITINTPFDIVTEFWCEEEGFPINVSMHLFDSNGSCVFNISTKNKPLHKGLHRAAFHIPANFMNDGVYYVNNMFVTNSQCHFNHDHAHSFEVIEDREASGWHGKWIGAVRPTFIPNDYLFISE
jgi:lipopolysaccharide transport system ATP-binding protein